jgi:hypothetical protein
MDAALGQDVPGSQRTDDDALMLMILLQRHHIWLPRGSTDIPHVSEFIPGYEVSAWDGLVAPKDTAAAIVRR